MKKLAILLCCLLLGTAATAQKRGIPDLREVAEVEREDGRLVLEVVNLHKDGVNHYFLNVGRIATGNKIIQIEMDPFHCLYIPLGSGLDEAVQVMERIKGLFKEANGTSMDLQGTYGLLLPGKHLERIILTKNKFLLANQIEFRLDREGPVMCTYVAKSDFSSLLSSVKFYRKLHPKER